MFKLVQFTGFFYNNNNISSNYYVLQHFPFLIIKNKLNSWQMKITIIITPKYKPYELPKVR